jgi:integrase
MQTRTRTKVPGVYQRGDRYQVTYRDHLGKQRSKTVRTMTEARQVKAAAETDRLRGDLGATTAMTLESYALEWIKHYTGRTSRGVADSTREVYETHLRCHVLPALGGAKLAGLTTLDIKRWLRGLSPDLSHGYRTNLLRTLRLIYATAVEESLVPSNPAAAVRLPALPRLTSEDEDEGPAKALSEDELARFLKASGAHRLFFDFLAETGLRISEAFGLQWGDFDGQQLKIRRQFTKRGYGPLKSRNAARTVPLSDYMREHLSLRRGPLTAPMFPSAEGLPQTKDGGMRGQLRRIREAAGLPWVNFHTFRHTCATRLFRAEANAKQVQQWMGTTRPCSPSTPTSTCCRMTRLIPACSTALGNALSTACPETTVTQRRSKPSC